jgi:hypothetical protein
MLHAGLDLSRRRLDVCLLDEEGNQLDQLICAPDGEALKTFAGRVDELHGGPVSAVIESMTGARFVHDTLECCGWHVEVADAQKVKGLAPFGLQDRPDRLDAPRDAEPPRSRPLGVAARSAGSRGARAQLAFACSWSSTSRCSRTASTAR